MSEPANLKKFYLSQIQKKEAEINEKIQNIKRLEAQRFELNSNGICLFIQYQDLKKNSMPCKKYTRMLAKLLKLWVKIEFLSNFHMKASM